MIQKTYFTHTEIDGASNIRFHGTFGMIAKQRVDVIIDHNLLRPLKNAPFCSIPASGSNFNPRNTQCITVVKIFTFLGLEQN